MRKAIIATLSIAVATIATSQADAKGTKPTISTIKFTKHYDKSSPVLLRQQTGSTTKPNTSGSSQKTGRK
jgi:type VI protein secretion system component Hcp